MLLPDDAVFPNNIVLYTASAMQNIDPDIRVFKRPLRNTDPQQSIGVSAQQWSPDDQSIEMQGLGGPTHPQLPTLQQYLFSLQAFVKDAEEERGLATHSVLAARVRSVLYTDPNLQVIFGGLSADLGNGYIESMRRWGVRVARYFSGEIQGQMLYLSTLEFWIETETRQS